MKKRTFVTGMTFIAHAATSLAPIVVDAAELPIPCIAGSCGAAVAGFLQSGQANATAVGNVLNVQQTSERAILNWASFNISADGRVVFKQPGASSVALNRIFGASPSQIFGALEANGQVYLVNQNGFLFGAGARVKTAGLLASTLNISDSTFQNGLLAADLLQGNIPALSSDGRIGVLDADGTPLEGPDGEPVRIRIAVEKGAEITTSGTGNRVMLAAQNIDNAGTISAPGGQVLLAAGEQVFLEASTDPALRGLLVEVNRGGEAWNRLTGDISATRGNVTIAGLAVNQHGRVSASTTVAANGSIRLLARDSVEVVENHFRTTQAGSVELGAQSSTRVLSELADTATAVDDQAQLASRVEIVGRQIMLRGGSSIEARGGEVQLTAVQNPRDAGAATYDAQSRIRMEAGARIDVSGNDATASITRNLVTVELRANELRDAPLQRDGALRGQPVVVDARVGTAFGNVTGALAAVPKTLAERTSAGGRAVFNSEGDIVVANGANIDVSGGTVNYAGGAMQTTQLVAADGSVVDISKADPNKLYVGAVNPTYTRRYNRWGVVETLSGPAIGRYEPGYVEGRDAGTLQFASPTMVLNGTFTGETISGPFQRDPARAPSGGRFIIGLPVGANPSLLQDHRAPSVNLLTTPPNIVVGDTGTLPRSLVLGLPVDFMQTGGFTRNEIYSNGVVTLPQSTPLNLYAGASLRVVAHGVDINSDIATTGGSINLSSEFTAGIGDVELPRPGVRIAPGVRLDVSGAWTNDVADSLASTAPLTNVAYRDAGSISLSANTIASETLPASELVVGANSQLLANAGAWLQASGTLRAGNGGRISLGAPQDDGVLEIGENVGLQAYGVQGAKGGTFELSAGRLTIESGTAWSAAQRFDPLLEDAGSLHLGDGLFSNHGFATFNLTATGATESAESPDVLLVREGSVVDTRTSSLSLLGSLRDRPTGSAVLDFARVALAPEIDRLPATLSLRVAPTFDPPDPSRVGRLSVEAGATLLGDARSSFSFSGVGGVRLDGSIFAASGTVLAQLPNPVRNEYDPGFLPQLQIEIGAAAVIDVSGSALLRPDDAGLQRGTVLPGGTIRLLADRGSVNLRTGSTLDVSGASAALDLPSAGSGYVRSTVGSAGGTIELRAPESIVALGNIDAHAGRSDTGSAPGGSLSIQLSREAGFRLPPAPLGDTFPTPPRTIRVVAHEFAGEPGSLNGLALLNVDWLRATGADALALRGGDAVEFESGVSLSMGRSLTVDSPVVAVRGQGTVNLSAPYVAFGYATPADRGAQNIAGAGTLNVRGDMIELIGATDLVGLQQATFASTGDLRMRSVQSGAEIGGALRIAGDLTLSAARIYPATATRFTVSALGGERDIVRIEQTGTSPGTPLSAAGSLQINAREIVQGGTLLAPFGHIALNAVDSLTLLDGSLTSVSGAGVVVPFGHVQLGAWLYELPSRAVTQAATPARTVELSGAEINMAPASTVDISGGGDLYAYEWLPGTGGSKDALDPLNSSGLYAILPSLRGQFAPYDPQELVNSDLKPGDSIYLSASDGVAAGIYPLLPARYALLPGAMLVRAVPGTDDIRPGDTTTLPSGAHVVAGYRTFASTGVGDTRYSGFALQPGSYARRLATYQDSLASTFFPARARRLEIENVVLPADAGSFVLSPMTSLDARGRVLTAAAPGGRRATIAITAQNLEIAGRGAAASPDAIQLDAAVLNAWNPSQLLLGARHTGANGTVEVVADTVSIAAGARLAFDEIVAVAREHVSIDAGASVSTNATTGDRQLADKTLTLTGEGAAEAAVLALSDSSRITVERPDSTSPAAFGSIVLAEGSQLASRGALLFDAPGVATLAGNIDGAGATWDLVSRRIAFGEEQIADGITIDSALTGRLQQASTVRLASSGAIDFLASTTLGTGTTPATFGIDALTLSAAVIRAAQPGIGVSLAANTLTLQGAGAADAQPLDGTGTLTLSADTLRLAAGVLSTEGFASTSLRANGDLIGDGAATLRVAGPLNLTAARLTTSSGADTHIESTGAVHIANAGSATTPSRALELGGALTIRGASVDHAGNIVLPSGLVRLEAVGDPLLSGGGLTLASGAVVDVSGRMVSAAGRQVASWGGTVSLAASGNIDAAADSRFFVGGAGNADAGRLILQAGGAAAVDSQLLGSSAAGAHGASFVLDAASLHDFAGLNARLESGGFNERRAIHVGSGDLTLDSGASINARFVNLATDQGAVRIAGTVNARSDSERSSIGLFGANGVILDSSAVLRAEGIGADSRGGLITLGTSAGDVSLLAGSAISAAGGLQDGRLLVRAPRVGNDVAVGEWAASMSDMESVTIEPVLAFDHAQSVLTAGDFAGYYNAAATYASVAVPAIRARLAVPGGTSLHVQPGIELRHEGDLSVSALALDTFRFDGEPGALTVRATGSIGIDGTISDGFVATGSGANLRVDLLAGRSATVRLTAGSSLASADTAAVAGGSSGDLTIGAGAVVRTGTGDLQLNAAHDIIFVGAGSSVYTGGIAGAPTLPSLRSTTFPTLGGQLQLNAGRDIVGSAVVQSPSQWQSRQGRLGAIPLASLWGLEVGKFGWNAGTLGGGDLSMSAGRDVRDTSAAAADSAIENSPEVLTRFAGGVLSVEAGGNISSALLHATHGENRVRADGALDATRIGNSGAGIGSVLSIQDAVVDITARNGVALESAFNPTLVFQGGIPSLTSTFSTYTERSALHVASASGDVNLNPTKADLQAVLGAIVNSQPDQAANLSLLPSSLTLRSLSNDVVLSDSGVTLSPSDRGQLDIFAARDLRNGILLTMSDASSATLPTPLRPFPGGTLMPSLVLGTSGRHLGDAQAVLVTAGRNIEGGGTLRVPKAARVIAGRDILNTSLTGQNLSAQDLTLISAGRDLRFFGTGSEEGQIQLGGPGRLDVIAGRDIDLGFSHGLSTVGRLVNPDLASDAGADLTVLAGLARDPDVSRFVDKVVAADATYRTALIDYVAAKLGQAPISFEASAKAFKALDSDAQRPFVVNTFFRELVASGREANRDSELGFKRGFTAIDMLFPGSRPADPLAQPNPYKGDLLLAFSRIYTVSGGTISLLAPGGLLNVGLANPPAGIREKPPSELGIVAQRAGDVRSFTDGDVLVNSSRVFTLGGGDIAIWSTTGDIDAGRGSKTAISVPPPAVLVDASGKVTLDFAGAVAGSGIRTILAGDVARQGDVDLIAPAGIVNAGDAGIGSARNINVAAQSVVGLDNIQVGGTSTGVPAETSNLGASLSGVSGVASSAASASSASVTQPQAADGAQQSLAASALSWLEVFVVGLGEEGCSPKDVECLKRQAPPASL